MTDYRVMNIEELSEVERAALVVDLLVLRYKELSAFPESGFTLDYNRTDHNNYLRAIETVLKLNGSDISLHNVEQD